MKFLSKYLEWSIRYVKIDSLILPKIMIPQMEDRHPQILFLLRRD